MKLRTLQTGLVLGLFGPFLLFIGILVAVLMERERSAAESSVHDMAKALASAFDRQMAATIGSLRVLAASEDLDEADIALYQADLDGAIAASREWHALAVFSPDGRLLSQAGDSAVTDDYRHQDIATAASPLDGDTVRQAGLTGEPAVSGSLATFADTPVLTVAVPVIREGGTRYVLAALYDARGLGSVFTEQTFDHAWSGVLLDRNYRIVAASRLADGSIDYRNDSDFRAAAATSAVGRIAMPSRAEPLVGYFVRSPLTGLAVALTVPEAQLLTPARELAIYVGGGGGALLLAGLFFAGRLGRRLSDDIHALAAPARTLGIGQLPVFPRSRIAEIQELSRELQNAATLLKTLLDEHDAVEEQLFRSEERYRGVVDYSQEMIWIHTDGRIIFANNAAARGFAVASPDDLVGRDVLSLYHPDDLAQIRARIAEIYDTGGRLDPAENRLVRADGAVLHVEVQPIPFWYEGASSILVMAHDITERRRIEEALRDSEQRFRDFAEVASDWLWELGPDLRFTYVSDRVSEKGGATPAFLIGRTPVELAAANTSPGAVRALLADLEAHRPFRDVRTVAERPDGEVHHVSVSGKPFFAADGSFLGYRGASTDFTPQAEAAARLRDGERRLADFVAELGEADTIRRADACAADATGSPGAGGRERAAG